ncbi:MAG TPA: response regulator [Burkholderiaceae bacterium]
MSAGAPGFVLVVEDEPRLALLVCDYLRAAGFEAASLADGAAVLPAVRLRPPDLIVLDLMLPNRDGLSLCRELRGFSDVPIVMVTARVEEVDRLIGLEAGADDYLCKPFSPRELVARVKAILRRPRSRVPVHGAGLVIDREHHSARINGQLLDLTLLEFRLLEAFASAPGRVFSRDQLIDKLHGDQRAISDRTIDSHIKNLRRKLEQACPDEEPPIRSIYGVGYKLEMPV